MASENPKPNGKRSAPANPPASPKEPAKAPPAKPPPLSRPVDRWAFAITAVLVFFGYLYTLAPDMTLEDSGELAVGSFYAGVPHPPGYPVWTIYTWLFTRILPFSNIAFRVGISSAFAGALSCGLIALMVSRGSSMFIEAVAEFKGIERRVENWICFVTGFVAGMLVGFNGFHVEPIRHRRGVFAEHVVAHWRARLPSALGLRATPVPVSLRGMVSLRHRVQQPSIAARDHDCDGSADALRPGQARTRDDVLEYAAVHHWPHPSKQGTGSRSSAATFRCSSFTGRSAWDRLPPGFGFRSKRKPTARSFCATLFSPAPAFS
jgi:hypothetical protein